MPVQQSSSDESGLTGFFVIHRVIGAEFIWFGAVSNTSQRISLCILSPHVGPRAVSKWVSV